MKKSPEHLKHRPIYEIKNYDRIDGQYKNDSDVYAISIGKAQWSESGEFIPSVKVWRKKNGRWSRQSEETTITRALDMAMLVVQILDHYYNNKSFSTSYNPFGNYIEIDAATGVDGWSLLEKELENAVKKSKNDIESHIRLLEEALTRYRE